MTHPESTLSSTASHSNSTPVDPLRAREGRALPTHVDHYHRAQNSRGYEKCENSGERVEVPRTSGGEEGGHGERSMTGWQQGAKRKRTVVISDGVITPAISCLLAKMSNEAPANLCARSQTKRSQARVRKGGSPAKRTSSCSSPLSSSRQSFIRSRSNESTTQMTASVVSK